MKIIQIRYFRFSRLVLLAGLICVGCIGCEEDNSDSGGGNNSESGGTVITQAEYEQIQNGMSYSQVVQIVGNNGYIWLNTLDGGVVYRFDNLKGPGAGTGVSVGFDSSDRVNHKASSGNLP